MPCQAWVQPHTVVFCWVASWPLGLALLTANAALCWPVALHTSWAQPTLTLTGCCIGSF